MDRQAGRAPQRSPGETGRLCRDRGFSGRGKGDPVAQVALRHVESDCGRVESGVWSGVSEQCGQLIVDHGVGRTVRESQRIRGRVGDLDLRVFGQRMVLRQLDPDAHTPQQEPAHATARLFTAGDPGIDAAVGDRGEISGVAIGTAPTSSPLLPRISLSTRAGVVSAPALRLYPMRSVPSSPAAALRAVSHARSSAASAGGADSAKAAPAVVNTTLRVLRTSRAVPSSASNRRIRVLSAGCAIPIRAAARVKFNSSASTRKYRRLTVSGATCPPCRLITIRSESIPYRSFPRPHIKP